MKAPCKHEMKMVRLRDPSGVKATIRCVACGEIDREALRAAGFRGIWVPHRDVPGGVESLPEWRGGGNG